MLAKLRRICAAKLRDTRGRRQLLGNDVGKRLLLTQLRGTTGRGRQRLSRFMMAHALGCGCDWSLRELVGREGLLATGRDRRRFWMSLAARMRRGFALARFVMTLAHFVMALAAARGST